jgi:putative endonuclease
MNMKGWMYILKCADDTFYTGSTNNLGVRLIEHENGRGANYTRKRLPVELVYYKEFSRIDYAFDREKQVQGWGRKKKLALIENRVIDLQKFAACQNKSHSKYFEKNSNIGGFGSAQSPEYQK